MLKLNGLGAGATKVVDAHELESVTSAGWKLVFTYQESTTMPFFEQEQAVGPNTYPGQTVRVQKLYPVTQTCFVVTLDADSSLERVSSELEKTKKALEASAAELKKLDEGAADAKKNLEAARLQASKWEQCHSTTQKLLDEARTQNRKIEEDIAKVRKAVGELRMKEILGGQELKDGPAR